MPAEPTKAAKRRSSRRDGDDVKFDGHAREVESKRSRGEISCAECRRLKIKCDKQIPCQSCMRRGCGNLCPNGSLATGQGTRFVLAATEHLHRRITKISNRVRELEDALAALQAQHSNEPHPLLREDLLSANIVDEEETASREPSADASVQKIMDGFGTLSMSDHGVSRFFGPTGGPESLLASNSTNTTPCSSQSPESLRGSKSLAGLPEDLLLFSQSFPFTPLGPAAAVQEVIEGHLPLWEHAVHLVDSFLDRAGWLFRTVSPEQIHGEMLPSFYERPALSSSPAPQNDHTGPHDLSLLYMVFAVGALVDLRQEPSNAEAEHYHQIARAAVCLQPVLEKPSLVTVQVLHLLSCYNAMSSNELGSQETSMETTWSLQTLAAHLSQTIGLHRDSARWGLSATMVERRRILFWHLFACDAWQSLNTGRPPTFSLAYIDCRLPEDPDQKLNDRGEMESGFGTWNIRFAIECVAEVAARVLTAETPSYTTVMELDRKVREFPLWEDAKKTAMSEAPKTIEGMTPGEAITLCVMSHAREVVLLYIHRSFFAQALVEYPTNPLKSPYAPSFLAAFRASTTILRTIREHFEVRPALCSRFWQMWTCAFSASVVFGTIVTKGPGSPLASNAMKELEMACVLFTKAAVHSRRAAKALPIVMKLAEKAQAALKALASQQSQQEGSSALTFHEQWKMKAEDPEDELAIFSGRTRFVSRRGDTNASPPLLPSPPVHATPDIQIQLPSLTAPAYRYHQQLDAPPSLSASSSRSQYSDIDLAYPAPAWEPTAPLQHYALPPMSSRGDQYHERYAATYPDHIAPPPSLPQTQEYRQWQQQYFAPPEQQRYSPANDYPVPSQQHHPQAQPHPQHHDGYAPGFLASRGVTARDSKLAGRWGNFMQDSIGGQSPFDDPGPGPSSGLR
ncbi:hypothetical protein FIBSPDRAFT_921010 [Athelia psychrophila]|uniref:Zn(2)-C6 fungal-type domain-containing protein n=1 Tax=Athelia psychrophila TaxID=1759441 RepID=A0A166F070_9AGAM|nr:hypothetical protein FIBSPDRAFT_921010 [Fibularhizoctonia sp. CBS 109695]